MLRRASSMAFCTAAGTSFDLPLPIPTRPSPSPTTVSAAKPRMRPPFTTLVTRLTAIIFSRRPSLRSSDPMPLLSILAMSCPSELEAAFAGGLRQRFHAAVVAESGAVEGHFRDPGRLRLLGDALAHLGRRFLLGAVGVRRAHFLLERGGRGEHLAAGSVDHLRVDVLVGAVHRQAHRALPPDAHARLRGAALSR